MANTLDVILDKLKENPIFKMSLGSKELFHSNFLEYIKEVDMGLFLSILNRLLPNNSELPNAFDYKLSRELENFDLCLYHEEVTSTKKKKDGQEQEKKQIVFDLILENKVKSIPRKEQLEEYENKVKNHNPEGHTTRYILLSLAEKFPDRQSIEDKKLWHVVTYKDLYDAINNELSRLSKNRDRAYISDYCEFIGNLHRLQEEILSGFENQSLFADVILFKDYRMHDLYIKLRCAYFLILLKEKLNKIGIKEVHFINNHGDIRGKYQKKGIYLNQNIFRSVGQAAAFIYKENGKDKDIFEIVIQGNQYRHGINSSRLAKYNKEKVESQNILWNFFNQKIYESEFLSLSKVNGLPTGDALPLKIRNNNKSNVKKIAPFCGYNHDYVYKYKDIDKLLVKDLLEIMTNDIKDVYCY